MFFLLFQTIVVGELINSHLLIEIQDKVDQQKLLILLMILLFLIANLVLMAELERHCHSKA